VFDTLIADPLLDALGVGVVPALLGATALSIRQLWQPHWTRTLRRACGWSIVTAATSTIQPVSGGAIGAWLAWSLSGPFTPLGTALVAVGVGVAGLALAADDWWAYLRRFRRAAPASAAVALAPTTAGGELPPMIAAAVALAPRPAPTPVAVPVSRATAKTATVAPRPAELPPLKLLEDSKDAPQGEQDQFLRERGALLERTCTDFGVSLRVVGINTGPVITQYEVALETGLRLSKVTALADDLALNLGVPSVRIVAPLPGKTTVGIELPNARRVTVRLKELIQATTDTANKHKLPIYLGKDAEGRPLLADLATMPHLLIAGRTGTGKSVCLNTIILSLLFTRKPEECKLLMIDPKKIEFSEYGKLPHLMHPVITENDKAEAVLEWAVEKMEERYELLRRARVRNISSYNELPSEELLRRIAASSEESADVPVQLPYIVIVIDEVGDLMMDKKKEVEGHIIRLAQKSRAAGIHLILATQKPTVDVITGLIKSNLPARICFQVASKSDSRVVLDEGGGEKLLGMGDLLYLQPGTNTLIRAQGAYVSDGEITRVVNHLECEPEFEAELLSLKSKEAEDGLLGVIRGRDPLYFQAVEVVVREQRGSTSLLQRALGIGYGKASRFIDFMAEDGIVGNFNGSQARAVLMTPEQWQQVAAA
jgi:S-DNA-T family DNA segregation ATPase FtsK/SpoIIIE